MIPFTTTDDQRLELYDVAATMKATGLPASFITRAVAFAAEYEGGYDLMMLWRDVGADANASEERDQILADLQEQIDEQEEAPSAPREKPYIHFDDLELIAKQVKAFKDDLRKKVDAWGGINKLARESGIPQPSLSRMFRSASMPRRTTLYKIARALGLPENEVVTDWIR